MNRKVMMFTGHVNEYSACKSVVDNLGSFIAAGIVVLQVNVQKVYTSEYTYTKPACL